MKYQNCFSFAILMLLTVQPGCSNESERASSESQPVPESQSNDTKLEKPLPDNGTAEKKQTDLGENSHETESKPDESDLSSTAEAGESASELRTWTDATGRYKTEARLVEFKDGTVRLQKKTGEFTSLTLERLSPADQAIVLGTKKSSMDNDDAEPDELHTSKSPEDDNENERNPDKPIIEEAAPTITGLALGVPVASGNYGERVLNDVTRWTINDERVVYEGRSFGSFSGSDGKTYGEGIVKVWVFLDKDGKQVDEYFDGELADGSLIRGNSTDTAVGHWTQGGKHGKYFMNDVIRWEYSDGRQIYEGTLIGEFVDETSEKPITRKGVFKAWVDSDGVQRLVRAR